MSSILDLTLGVTALAGMSDGVRNDLVAVVTCIAKASVGVAVEIIHTISKATNNVPTP